MVGIRLLQAFSGGLQMNTRRYRVRAFLLLTAPRFFSANGNILLDERYGAERAMLQFLACVENPDCGYVLLSHRGENVLIAYRDSTSTLPAPFNGWKVWCY